MNDYDLNTSWCVWYHSLLDKEWTKQSYKMLFTITNLYDLKGVNELLLKNHLQNGMFFIMREGIFPTWEDPDNRNGCCVSYKISGSVLQEEWKYILNRILTEDILINKEQYNLLNGLSISPKKEFNVLKIWLRENLNKDETYRILKTYEPTFIPSKVLIKKHDIGK